MKDEGLRALIRLLPAARALKEDLEKSLHLDTWAGTGDTALRMFQGLQKSVAALSDDVYVQCLEPDLAKEASDKEKVATVALAAGQLLAYLEGQTGLGGFKGGGETHIQTAPTINMGGSKITTTPEIMERMLGRKGAAGDDAEEEEEEAEG